MCSAFLVQVRNTLFSDSWSLCKAVRESPKTYFIPKAPYYRLYSGSSGDPCAHKRRRAGALSGSQRDDCRAGLQIGRNPPEDAAFAHLASDPNVYRSLSPAHLAQALFYLATGSAKVSVTDPIPGGGSLIDRQIKARLMKQTFLSNSEKRVSLEGHEPGRDQRDNSARSLTDSDCVNT